MAEARKTTNNDMTSSTEESAQNTNNAAVTGEGRHEATRQDPRYLTENFDIKAKSERAKARAQGIEELKDRVERENRSGRGRVRRRGTGRGGFPPRSTKPATKNSNAEAADPGKVDVATGTSQPKWKDDDNKNLGRPGKDPDWKYDHSD